MRTSCVWRPPRTIRVCLLPWIACDGLLPRTLDCQVKVTLRLTASQSVSICVEPPSGAHDQIFVTVWHLRILFLWGALSDERQCLSFVYAAGPCQRSLSRVRDPWYSNHILLSQIWDFPFRRLLRLAGSRWRYSTPPPHGFFICNWCYIALARTA
jgi:hypothetical protein